MSEDSGNKLGRREFMDKAATAAGLMIVAPELARGTATQSGKPRKWRYGVVGTGARARGSHLPILLDYIPEAEIVALCDITPENLQEGLKICGGKPAGYSDYRRMLTAHPELDAVVVVVPNFLHAQVAIDAMKAGKHVLTEKPVATDLADAARMIETAARTQRILQVGFEWRYSPVFHRMADLIRQGAIGKVEIVYSALFRGDWNPKSWKYTDSHTGKLTNWRFLNFTTGGSLLEDGIHELDVIHWLVGAEPSRIDAQGGNNVYVDRETIDNAELLIEFLNKARCIFGFSLFTPGVQDGLVMRFYGSQGEMIPEWGTEDGGVVITPYHGKAGRIPVPYFEPAEKDVWTDLQKKHPHWDSMACDMEMSTYRVHKTFLHSMATGEQPFSSGEVGRDAIQISLAAEQSLRNGGRALGLVSK